MALTPEVIKANPELATLTDAQLTQIATLSANDEATVINTKIGEHHGLLEKDVKEVSGIDKNNGEKSFEYMKRVLTSFKEKTVVPTELQTKIAAQETKIKDLETKIAEGKGNEVSAQKLKDAEDKLAALNTQYETEKATFATEKTKWETEKIGIKVGTEFSKATSAITFKPGYPESVQKTLIQSAEAAVLGKYKADWVDADGKQIMVFRDSKNEIVRNPTNQLNPYTAAELLAAELKDVIDLNIKKEGIGTNKVDTKTVVDIVDIGAAKSQVEADELIVKHLLQKGFVKTDPRFAEEQQKIRKENNVASLPIQ